MLVYDNIESMNEMKEDERDFQEFAAMNTNNADASNVFITLDKEELIYKGKLNIVEKVFCLSWRTMNHSSYSDSWHAGVLGKRHGYCKRGKR